MTITELKKRLAIPEGRIDAVLDTDAYNEIDDQFAIAYMLLSGDKINTLALYAAPFFNDNSTGPADGMERSYNEIKKLLGLLHREDMPVYRGSERYLENETTPVISDAARDLAARCESYSPENPLYVVAIGAITNVASAILLNPNVAKNCVVVWLGGHSLEFVHTKEFNMMQDVAGARVLYESGVPLVQLPCYGVVSEFRISRPELEYWLVDKNPLADYLARNTISCAESYAKGKPWTRVIWDVCAVAWLLNGNERFMYERFIDSPLPGYDHQYDRAGKTVPLCYVCLIKRDPLMRDLIDKLVSFEG